MRMGIAFEKKYAKFKRCVEMPKKGTPLHTWQKTQLSNGPISLNAKIRKEFAENKGSTRWSERRVKLVNCVEKKNCAKMSIAWEEKYAEFVSYDGMPKKGTLLHTWQQNQLSNGANSLNDKIRKEKAEHIGNVCVCVC